MYGIVSRVHACFTGCLDLVDFLSRSEQASWAWSLSLHSKRYCLASQATSAAAYGAAFSGKGSAVDEAEP